MFFNLKVRDRMHKMFITLVFVAFFTKTADAKISTKTTSSNPMVQALKNDGKPPVNRAYRKKRSKKTKLHLFKKWVVSHTVDIGAVICALSASSVAAYYLLPSFLHANETIIPVLNIKPDQENLPIDYPKNYVNPNTPVDNPNKSDHVTNPSTPAGSNPSIPVDQKPSVVTREDEQGFFSWMAAHPIVSGVAYLGLLGAGTIYALQKYNNH